MSPTRLLRRPPLCAALVLALSLLTTLSGCASHENRREEQVHEVNELIRTTRYQEAVDEAERLLAESPDDPELRTLQRRTITARMLDHGRRLSFDDHDEEALEVFEQALEVSPDSKTVTSWIEKTHRKLAEKWLAVALEEYAKDDLGAAIEAYEWALSYIPGHPSALRGLGETTILMNHRLGLGDDYYSDGVTALTEYWLRQARRNFSATEKYIPENERATSRREESEVQIADNRVAVALDLEDAGLFGASLREFKLALALDAGNARAAEGAERVEPEFQAAELIRAADMLIRRERYEEALEKLGHAEPLTERQHEAIAGARQSVSDNRLETLYQRALNLERDQQYPEAIVAYEKLFEFIDYYKDARTRQDTLGDYVTLAADYYERAKNADSPSERLDLLRAIRGFWSEYRDVGEQIAKLEPIVEPQPEEGGEGDPSE